MVSIKFDKILKNLTLFSVTTEPIRLPNVGYMGKGYDIYKGNPREIGSVDPGFQLEPIFNLTIDSDLTPDGRYILPKGVVAERCDACVIDFETNFIKNIIDYKKEIERSVSVDTGADIDIFKSKFAASQTYKYVHKSTSEEEKKYTMNEANCMLYCMKGLIFSPREISANFLNGASLLTDNSNDYIYKKFIEAFGTHYIHSMKMGSNFGVLTEFSKTSWDKMTSEETSSSISYSASIDALLKAGVDIKEREKIERARKFESYSEKIHIHSTGASLPSSGKWNDWVPNALENPMPQSYELRDITDLLNNEYFPNDDKIDSKRENLKQAIKDYCSRLKEQGKVETCDEISLPPETPPSLDMFNCPINYNGGSGAWATIGCVGHLAQVDICRNAWWNRGIHNVEFACDKTAINKDSIIYACPIDVGTDGGAWASFGCNGQLSLWGECKNIWWSNGIHERKIPCNRFDVSSQTIYKCPHDARGGGGSWASTGCIGQYSQYSKCYNYWWNNGLNSIALDCQVQNFPKGITQLISETNDNERLINQQAQIEVLPK